MTPIGIILSPTKHFCMKWNFSRETYSNCLEIELQNYFLTKRQRVNFVKLKFKFIQWRRRSFTIFIFVFNINFWISILFHHIYCEERAMLSSLFNFRSYFKRHASSWLCSFSVESLAMYIWLYKNFAFCIKY